MRVAILSCGAIVIKEQDQEWLFGAPEGVDTNLKEAGIDVPRFVFLTALRSPGYTKLGGNIVSFKEKPLSMNGLSATPIKHKHGTDFFIQADGAKVLFSERGDVAAKDLEDYDLCIIKNKHRGDDWQDHIVTWPWPDAEYSIADGKVAQVGSVLKVWSSMEDVPSNLKVIEGATLSLAQANYIAKVAKAAGEDGKENWAIAVDQFKNEYKKDGDKWMRKEPSESEEETKTKEKISKADANYRPAESEQKCGNCAYYSDVVCSRVAGDIDPEYVSDIYAPVEEVQAIVGNEMSRMAVMEAVKDSDGRTAKDFLIAEDPKKVTTWHLPVKTDGKVDRDLMGGAAAALAAPKGHRGNKYEGPDKEKAIRKLVAMYHAEDIDDKDIPEHLMSAYERLKELTEEGPVQRLGDMLVADLHTAYNNFADQWYKQGFMDETERKQVGQSIGEALKALRSALPKELQDRVLGGPVTVPTTLKEWAPGIPDTIDGSWSTVYKSDDGVWHWATITSSSVWDGHNEYVPAEAMDYAISVAKVIGPGPLRFKHAPGLDGGECTHQACAGGFLFERGDFYDNDIGQAMCKLLQRDPTWKISPGLLYTPKDLVNGVYKRVVIFERSMTQEPANQTTAILATDGGLEMAVKQLSKDELAQVAKDLELDVKYVTKLHQQALKNGGGVVGLKEFQAFVEKESKSSKADDEEETMDEEEMTEEEKKTKAKELLAGLEPEQRKILKELMEETEAPEVRLQAEVTQLKEALAEQGQRMDQMITLLAGNLSGKSKERAGDDALAEFINSLPRRQAQFVSKELGTEPDDADTEIMALLKEIRSEMQAGSGNPFSQGGHIYDSFTSKRMNPSSKES